MQHYQTRIKERCAGAHYRVDLELFDTTRRMCRRADRHQSELRHTEVFHDRTFSNNYADAEGMIGGGQRAIWWSF